MLSDRLAVRTHRNGSVIDQNLSVTFVIFSRQHANLSKHLAIYEFSSARKLPSRVAIEAGIEEAVEKLPESPPLERQTEMEERI
jgi:hypothetical protein